MQPSEKVRTRIHTLDERLARLRMAKNRLLARASHAERKRDTRRKILIGGAVLAALERDGLPSMRSFAELQGWLDTRLTRPHDRAASTYRCTITTAPSRLPAFGHKSYLARSEASVKEADQGTAKRRAASLTCA
jgi:hypothetical protein